MDKVDELWKQNPKIPFMQSKDILRLGYELGKNESKNKNTTDKKVVDEVHKTPNSRHKNSSLENTTFVGTTKELIEYGQKTIKEQTTVKEEKHKANNRIRLDVVLDINDYIKNNKSLNEEHNYFNTVRDIRSYITQLINKYSK